MNRKQIQTSLHLFPSPLLVRFFFFFDLLGDFFFFFLLLVVVVVRARFRLSYCLLLISDSSFCLNYLFFFRANLLTDQKYFSLALSL